MCSLFGVHSDGMVDGQVYLASQKSLHPHVQNKTHYHRKHLHHQTRQICGVIGHLSILNHHQLPSLPKQV